MKEILPFIHPDGCIDLEYALSSRGITEPFDYYTIETIACDYVFTRIVENADRALEEMREIFNPQAEIYSIVDDGHVWIYVSPVPETGICFHIGTYLANSLYLE